MRTSCYYLFMSIICYSRGAAEEVTGSRHYIEIDGTYVVQIDGGAFQGRRQESEEKNRESAADVREVDAVLLTHAHFDHSGMIPLLTVNGYEGPIYATSATCDLASLIMYDSAKIQASDIAFLTKQAARKGIEFSGTPLYTAEDVERTLLLMQDVPYREPVSISPQMSARFLDAGHILGSSQIVLEVKDHTGKQISVAYSGDLGRKDKPIIADPEPLPDVDYLFLESTYGDRLHQPSDDAMKALADVVNDTVARGGKVVIPAFAIERTQELVYLLHLLTDLGRIPELPIYIDSPMAINATKIFQDHPECYDEETREAFLIHHKNPFGFTKLIYTRSVESSKQINEEKGPAIIISADGMCEAGRIRHHLVHTIEDPANTILIVGYMAQNTLGRRILDGQRIVRIFHDQFEVRAKVERIEAFSAHADYRELTAHVRAMDLERLRTVFLVHGEPEAQEALRLRLLDAGVRDVRIVRYGERYQLI